MLPTNSINGAPDPRLTLRGFVGTIPRNAVAVFTGRHLLWHLAAIALTAVIVLSGADWSYYEHTRSIPEEAYFPAVILGAFVPLVAPLTLLIIGRIARRTTATRLGLATGQAAVVAFLVSSTYKAFTGRVQPALGENAVLDTSRDFNFGFLEHGIFWGWPSGHTTTAFAMVVTLIALQPGRKVLALAALSYSFYIGLSISVSIHWLSEFVAGSLFGTAIGLVVGNSFAPDPQPQPTDEPQP